MPKSPCYKPVHIKPVNGFMDNRSLPDQMAFGSYRLIENMRSNSKNTVCRMPGWRKLGYLKDDNNWDLHNQLFGYTRQPITMLFEAQTPTSFTKLFAATQNRIYAQNNDTGNWKVISDQLGGALEVGCPDKRFTAAQVNNTVIFTNGVDKPVYHVLDQPTTDGLQSVELIPDLEDLGIGKVKVVVAWNNMIFLMNIEEGNEWHGNRIHWSDLRAPLSFRPGNESVSGRYDLDYEDSIIAVAPIGKSLLIYTTAGIWEAKIVGGQQVVSFNRRWPAPAGGKRTMAYPNTLVSTGKDHYYWGNDGIYRYNLFLAEPELVEWIHIATKSIFDDINKVKCGMHVGGFKDDTSEIWWSWGKEGDTCPTKTLVVNTEFPFTSFVTHGISAFLYHEPDNQRVMRRFMLENCICTLEELDTYAGNFAVEGGFECETEVNKSCPTPPKSFYSGNALTDPDGFTSEDYLRSSDSDSLFAQLGAMTVGDYCRGEFLEDECNANKVFIFACAQDFSLKEMRDDVYIREVYDPTDVVAPCGKYTNRGYKSRLLSGPADLNLPDDTKIVRRFYIEAHTSVQETKPADVKLSLGMSANAFDPLVSKNNCVLIWEEQDRRDLKCLSPVSLAKHRAEGTRPDDHINWKVFHRGRYFYYDIVIDNPDAPVVDSGGIVCFSRYTFEAVADPSCA